MTGFDEWIGGEPPGAERDRLHNVHQLLVEAGPPPELPPNLAAGPTLAMTLSRFRLLAKRRRLPILTIAAAVVVALIIGVGASLHGRGPRYPSIPMRGVSFATGATGTLELLPTKAANVHQRMRLEVTGLPALKQRYVVYLVRNGHKIASCGNFLVPKGSREVTENLDSPYPVKGADSWVVTVGSTTVLQPVT